MKKDPHKLAAEIFAHHRRRELAQGGMVKSDIMQVVPSPNQEDFLSDEQDDSYMLHNNEDFLSDEMTDPSEEKEPNIPDTDPKPLVATIMERMKAKKLKNRRV